MSSRRQNCRARRVQPFHFYSLKTLKQFNSLRFFTALQTKLSMLLNIFHFYIGFSLTRTFGIIFEAWFFTRGKTKIKNRNKRIMTSGESRFKLIKTFTHKNYFTPRDDFSTI